MKAKLTCIFGLGLLMLTGCGYSLNHRLKSVFTEGPIYVKIFDNRTDEAGAERVFTDAIIRELRARKSLTVVDSPEAATLELQGYVAGIEYAPAAFTANAFGGLQPYRRMVSDLSVRATIGFRLVNRKTQNVVWEKAFSSFRRIASPLNRTYDFEAPSSNSLLIQTLVESQYSKIAQDIIRDVYDEMIEFF